MRRLLSSQIDASKVQVPELQGIRETRDCANGKSGDN